MYSNAAKRRAPGASAVPLRGAARGASVAILWSNCGVLLLDDEDELAEAPSASEAAFAGALSPEQVTAIDERLLRQSSKEQRKVARVISDALADAGLDAWDDGCLEFHARRVILLAHAGHLEAFGNVRKPRWSEVRLPTDNGAGRDTIPRRGPQ